jgi:hypothetical protein
MLRPVIFRARPGNSVCAEEVRNDAVYSRAMHKIRVEADITAGRWMDLHVMKQFFGNFQAIYARTVHTAQGDGQSVRWESRRHGGCGLAC